MWRVSSLAPAAVWSKIKRQSRSLTPFSPQATIMSQSFSRGQKMLAYLFVVIAVAFRFIPHPWGFTPIPASLLFFGAKAPRRMLWLPVALMMVCDIVLTKYVYGMSMGWDQWVTWAWYAGILWLGTNLKNNQKPVRIAGASLTTSVSFFVISSLAVWEAPNLYPDNVA